MSFVNSDQNLIIYWGAGIFQELRSEFRSQKQLASPMVLQKKLSKRFSALHCTVYCTKAYHHHGYMYFQQQQRTQHQPKRSKYGKRQGHLHSDASSHNSILQYDKPFRPSADHSKHSFLGSELLRILRFKDE